MKDSLLIYLYISKEIDRKKFKEYLNKNPIKIRRLLLKAYKNKFISHNLFLDFLNKYPNTQVKDYFSNEDIKKHDQIRLSYFYRYKKIMNKINQIRMKIWQFN